MANMQFAAAVEKWDELLNILRGGIPSLSDAKAILVDRFL